MLHGSFLHVRLQQNLKDKGAGNGTQCRVLSVKLKRNQTSHMWKTWNNRKVWTVCASDVEWVELEHFPKTQEIDTLEAHLKRKRQAHLENATGADSVDIVSIDARLDKAIKSRRFKLVPKLFTRCAVKVSLNDLVLEQQLIKCNIT